jgi:two-component system, cell cycle sensor histidine kinase and response regulator CckA
MTAALVRAEQIRTLYRQSLPVLLTSVVNAVIVSATLWSSASRRFLLGWTGLMALMTVIRLALRRAYWRKQPGPEDAGRWGAYFVVGSTVAGVLWGVAAFVLFDPSHAFAQILIPFVIGGMGAGAAGTISAYRPAFLAYLVPSVVPVACRMLAIGGPLYLAMGIMILVYAFAMWMVGRNLNRSITTAFELRFENEDLVERLSSVQLSLEETNRNLEQRVAERSLALEQHAEALRNAQRMEAVGRLAGGIAHDFNNLLTVVLGNASRLLHANLDASASTALEDVRSAATRGAELVRQLLAFSRRQRLCPIVLDLNQVVGELDRLLAPLIGANIELRFTVTPERPLVRADRSQLGQVLVNLVTNARDAMPEGGSITIATACARMPAGHPAIAPGEYAVLSVADTGVGIDPAIQPRVFDPFFTTKEQGKGTGLGLATVHGIVEQSGGHITLTSELGHGARFDVYLPRLPESERGESVLLPSVATREIRASTIVVAEDEALVRSVIMSSLEGAGHHVLGAENGERALELILQHVGQIDLLISDIVMPRLEGPELARRVRGARPAMRVLLISGHGWDAPPDPGIHFLQKPFTAEMLMQKVASVLAS